MFDARAAVSASQDADEFPPYEFTGLDGNQYQLPNALTLTMRQVDQLEADPKGFIEEFAPDAAATLLDLPLHGWQQLGADWHEHAEEAGKSLSPSRPVRRAAKRSKQT